jgi:hypothetical protein
MSCEVDLPNKDFISVIDTVLVIFTTKVMPYFSNIKICKTLAIKEGDGLL